jgi:hypothetical protein
MPTCSAAMTFARNWRSVSPASCFVGYVPLLRRLQLLSHDAPAGSRAGRVDEEAVHAAPE